MKQTVIKTEEEMIFTGHHWLVSHAKRLQDELIALRAAAELAFTILNDSMEPGDYGEEPAPEIATAHRALFELLDKAPAPEHPDPSGGDLPF